MTQWERKIELLRAHHDSGKLEKDPISWFNEHTQPDDLMLAHALDGVIWGRQDTSGNWDYPPTSPELRLETLQQIRVFNLNRELYVWKTHNTWYFRIIKDGIGDIEYKVMDESHILSGTSNHNIEDKFAKLTQGEEGLIHAPPLTLATNTIHPDKPDTRIGLGVRHYLDVHADSAITTIIASRLVNVEVI